MGFESWTSFNKLQEAANHVNIINPAKAIFQDEGIYSDMKNWANSGYTDVAIVPNTDDPAGEGGFASAKIFNRKPGGEWEYAGTRATHYTTAPKGTGLELVANGLGNVVGGGAAGAVTGLLTGGPAGIIPGAVIGGGAGLVNAVRGADPEQSLIPGAIGGAVGGLGSRAIPKGEVPPPAPGATPPIAGEDGPFKPPEFDLPLPGGGGITWPKLPGGGIDWSKLYLPSIPGLPQLPNWGSGGQDQQGPPLLPPFSPNPPTATVPSAPATPIEPSGLEKTLAFLKEQATIKNAIGAGGAAMLGLGLSTDVPRLNPQELFSGTQADTDARIAALRADEEQRRAAAEAQYTASRAAGRGSLEQILGQGSDEAMRQAIQGREQQLNRQGLLGGPSGALNFAVAQEAANLRRQNLPALINYENQSQAGLDAQRAQGLAGSLDLGRTGLGRNFGLTDEQRQASLLDKVLSQQEAQKKRDAYIRAGSAGLGYALGGKEGLESAVGIFGGGGM